MQGCVRWSPRRGHALVLFRRPLDHSDCLCTRSPHTVDVNAVASLKGAGGDGGPTNNAGVSDGQRVGPFAN
jgi:hypothetical protein